MLRVLSANNAVERTAWIWGFVLGRCRHSDCRFSEQLSASDRQSLTLETLGQFRMRMKNLIILSAVVVLFVGFVLWCRWDSATNHGLQFGYYGDFNRVINALASIPGITVTHSWHNCDVTLEEFGFTATKGSGEPLGIAVGEHDHIRSLFRRLTRSGSQDRDSSTGTDEMMCSNQPLESNRP